MKIPNTLLAWLAVIVLALLGFVLVLNHQAVPNDLQLALTVALGAAGGLSVPSGVATPTDVVSEIRLLLNDVLPAQAAANNAGPSPASASPAIPTPPPLTPPAAPTPGTS